MSLGPVIDFRLRLPTAPFDASLTASHEAVWWHTRTTPLWRDEPYAADQAHVRTVDACVAWLTENQILGVLPGRGMPGVAIPNDHLHELCVAHPGRFAALVGIDASQRRDAMDEIERCHKLGFVGVHFETGWLQPPLAADSPLLYPIYGLCEDLGLLAVIHAGPLGGPDHEHTHPGGIARMARDFPRLRIVMSHGGYPYVDDAVMCVFKHPNVWLAPDPYHDFPGGERYVAWANRSPLVAERMVYGSSHGWPNAPHALERFVQLGWRDDVLEQVLYSNAAELLAR